VEGVCLNPQDLIKEIEAKGFLSHMFCQVDSKLIEKGDWEIGYYQSDIDKIVTYVNGHIKNADDVFKKPGDKVEELNLDNVKISLDDAKKTFLENVPVLFPKELLGDGFIILQTIDEKTDWNFTLISKSLKFLNIKINATSGEVDSHQAVELMQK
jgi:hypothetical protein